MKLGDSYGKLAHEIRILTPIQLSIDSLREKYRNKFTNQSQEFEKYLETINNKLKTSKMVMNFQILQECQDQSLKKIIVS